MTANKARQDRPRAYVPRCAYTCTLVPLPLYPWYPIPTTYIHTCIDTFVYLIVFVLVFVFVCLIVFVSLTLLFLLTLSPLALSLPVARPAPWAGAAGFISLVCVNVLFYLIISQEYVCTVCIHVSLHIRQYMCMHYSLCMYPTDVCVCT